MKRVQRRTNVLWGLVLVAAAIVVLLRALDVIPDGMFDLLSRAWPVLLILGGLSVLLRDRVPMGSLVALVVSIGVVGGVTAFAFSSRANQPRTDYQQPIEQVVSEDVSLLQVVIHTRATDVEVLRSTESRTVTGEFTGSSESELVTDYAQEGATATFQITEAQSSEIPMLESIGRGRLQLQLPADVALDVVFTGLNGAATFNVGELALERLNLTLEQGDALVSLPEYQPLSPTVASQPGNLLVRNGNITVIVPDELSARFELNRGGSGLRPLFNDALYFYLEGDILQARTYDNAETKVSYIVTAPAGQIRVEEVTE